MVQSAPVPTSSDGTVSLQSEDQPRRRGRRGRRAQPPAPSPVARELRHRREMLRLAVRAAAQRTGVSPGVISEIETGRRIPSLSTYAKLRRELGLEIPPSVLVPPRTGGTGLLDDHLTALAACVVLHRGAPLADIARALGVSIPAVREGILRIADRLEAVGFRVAAPSFPSRPPRRHSTCWAPWSGFRRGVVVRHRRCR